MIYLIAGRLEFDLAPLPTPDSEEPRSSPVAVLLSRYGAYCSRNVTGTDDFEASTNS